MKDFTVLFVILIIATIFYIFLEKRSLEVVYIKSKNGDTFLVRKATDQQQSANLLSDICLRIEKLIRFLKNNSKINKYNYQFSSTLGPKELNEGIKRLEKNFNKKSVYENRQFSEGNTSFSVNKGERIIFCIRQKDGTLCDINTMMFVAIHECAHLMAVSIGHTTEFWDYMRFLLKESIKCNIYDYVNYNHSPEDYCGMVINDTPLQNFQ